METRNLTVKQVSYCLFLSIFVIFCFQAHFSEAETHYREFVIQAKPVKRLCRTHNTITVNGLFPGPTLEVRDGDTLVIKAVNNARYNVTLHWHGIRQLRNPWADGPDRVTQCPIRPGRSYTYRFTIENQEGTLWWHAHSRWLRATVYGALIIHPKLGFPYPFPMPRAEIPILLGEWWDRNPMDVLRIADFTGAAPNVSDAYTINGQPGDLYRCSKQGTVRFPVGSGETILLRVINSGLNQELFFGVANHRLTVVAVDAAYTKPFTTSVIMIAPGQTTDVLLTADQTPGHYYMAARAYNSANAPFDNTTTTAILEYKTSSSQCQERKAVNTHLPKTPRLQRHKQCDCIHFPSKEPFQDFPPVPPVKFDYTGNVSRGLWQPVKSTKLYKLKFGAKGQALVTSNPRKDPARFNLIDPPYRNTIGTPPGGWVAIRFEADNPGIWLMHCHLDSHLNWGLAMAFLVENGVGILQSVQPPPLDLPRC
ncbi:hypothetical protein NC651_030910 [Populus alba x Populus x berolinensis]|nr:hypothetical protein NC651_030910 [Populus alba x Populus x berolinensis]